MLRLADAFLSKLKKINGSTFFVLLLLLISSQYCVEINNDKKEILSNRAYNSVVPLNKNFSFPVGLGIHGFNLNDTVSSNFSRHFNSITTANAMKFEAIHPHADEYYWKEADSLVDFAKSNNMVVRGHTLLWSARNPYWLFWDEKGNLVNRKLLEHRLKQHIHTVVNRYKGKVYAWDVVNEAVYDNDKEFLKPNGWYKIMGAAYIKKAFEFAHEADSNAILFYNEYDAERPDKLNRITKLIKWLQSENVPIHGMGIQGHWTLNSPSVSEIKTAIETYADLGLEVQITELDVVLPVDFKGSEAEKVELLVNRYSEIFEVLYSLRDKISGITFWQTSDNPMKYPPLFDEKLKPTRVYQSIVNAWSEN